MQWIDILLTLNDIILKVWYKIHETQSRNPKTESNWYEGIEKVGPSEMYGQDRYIVLNFV